jgi:hypothetical protein
VAGLCNVASRPFSCVFVWLSNPPPPPPPTPLAQGGHGVCVHMDDWWMRTLHCVCGSVCVESEGSLRLGPLNPGVFHICSLSAPPLRAAAPMQSYLRRMSRTLAAVLAERERMVEAEATKKERDAQFTKVMLKRYEEEMQAEADKVAREERALQRLAKVGTTRC